MNNNILHWSYRDFRDFPVDLLEHKENVEEVYLKENFIPSIPEWLFEFTNLRFIHLGGNMLKTIPDGICLLANLQFLDVSKNQITELPRTFTRMMKLTRFNCSDNKITEITKDIGKMVNLETLDFSKNLLTRIPIELANCVHLNELLFNNNKIIQIPTKIINLPQLEVFEADGCLLEYLPGMVGRMLTHVRIFNNSRVTHYPVIYEKYLKLHYDYWSESVVSADMMMIFLPDESKRTTLPNGMRTVHLSALRKPASLVELGLKALCASTQFYQIVCDNLEDGMFPLDIQQRIMDGPATKCGNDICSSPLFTECYFLLLKKNKSSSQIIFSNMFCSIDCTDRWLNLYKDKYHKINATGRRFNC